MQLPFFRTPLFIGGVSAAGLGGAGAVGWSAYDSANPPAQRQMEGKGLKRNPLVTSGLGVYDTTSVGSFTYQDNPTTTPSACFKNFFPGAESISLSETTNSSTPVLTNPTNSNSGTIQGCALAQLAYKHDSSKTDDYGSIIDGLDFKSEVVFKNNNIGGAIGTLWNGGKETGTGRQTLHYYVAFLEKNDDKATGSIKGGYKGADTYGSDDLYKSVQIEMPSENLGLKHGVYLSNSAQDNNGHKKQFIGQWEEADAGKEVLSGMDIRAFKTKNGGIIEQEQCELFCKEQKEFNKRTSVSSFEPLGFKKEAFSFSKESGTGKVNSQKKQTSIATQLDNGFKPFKDRKGKGIEWKDDFCSESQSKRDLSPQDLIKLENFCYSK